MKNLRQAGQITLTRVGVSWYYKDNNDGPRAHYMKGNTHMIRTLGYLIVMSTTAVIFTYALCMWTTQDLGRPHGLTERMARYEQILQDK